MDFNPRWTTSYDIGVSDVNELFVAISTSVILMSSAKLSFLLMCNDHLNHHHASVL